MKDWVLNFFWALFFAFRFNPRMIVWVSVSIIAVIWFLLGVK